MVLLFIIALMSLENAQPSEHSEPQGLDGAGRLSPRDADTRRGMLEWALKGGFVTAVISGYTLYEGSSKGVQLGKQVSKAEAEEEKALEQHKPLEVKYFAHHIIATSERLTTDASSKEIVEMVSGFFVGSAVGGFLVRHRPEFVKRIIGSGSAAVATAGDLVSTIAFAGPLSDPRMKEYGLDAYIYEINSSLGAHPTVEKVKENILPQEIYRIIIGALFPSIGRGYLGAVPFIMSHNYKTAAAINLALIIGDKVAEMIHNGKTKTEIDVYLEGIKLKKQAKIDSQQQQEE